MHLYHLIAVVKSVGFILQYALQYFPLYCKYQPLYIYIH